MIPPAISARLAVCSEAELDVLWLAFADLLTGIEKGRVYGREPGRDGRDYVAEAREELRDGLLYLAMAMVKQAANPALCRWCKSADCTPAVSPQCYCMDCEAPFHPCRCRPDCPGGECRRRGCVNEARR